MSDERFHPDELHAVESRAQTEHKLEVMRRYYPTYASIIAQSKSPKIDNRHIWLVDLFAGAGLHKSADHPDGRVLGTALQACAAARDVQGGYPASRVHVRLVDLSREYCGRLTERAAAFHSRGVDVQVMEGDYALAARRIMAEVLASGQHCLSLWFVDPHGPTILEFNKLLPFVGAGGTEVIINLDITGVERLRGYIYSSRVQSDPQKAEIAKKYRKDLDLLYRGNYWEEPERHIQVRPSMSQEARLAEAYLLPFRMFRFKHAYPLRSSDSQFRYLIHLSRVPAAEGAFKKTYEASWKIGSVKGRTLDDTDCARLTIELHQAYRGLDVTLDDMHEDQVVALDRGQLGRVLRYAANNDYGNFDGTTMKWNEDRVDRFSIQASKSSPDSQMELF